MSVVLMLALMANCLLLVSTIGFVVHQISRNDARLAVGGSLLVALFAANIALLAMRVVA